MPHLASQYRSIEGEEEDVGTVIGVMAHNCCQVRITISLQACGHSIGGERTNTLGCVYIWKMMTTFTLLQVSCHGNTNKQSHTVFSITVEMYGGRRGGCQTVIAVMAHN